MAKALTFGNALVNAETDAAMALHNNGYLRIYDGAKPATPDTAITTQNLLAELRFANPAFGASANGQATANAIAAVNASRTGVASWARTLEADGVTGVLDGTVGDVAGQTDFVIDSVNIQLGAQVSVTSMSYTNPKQ